jgi:hypothetical protein
MTSDDTRYSQYFTSRAATLQLPPGDPTSFAARAATRRRRRRTAGTGLAALALVAAAVGVQQIGRGDDGGAQLAAQANAVTAADPLQWTTVVPTAGLAWSSSIATTEDGTAFGLATAPGRYDPETAGGPRTLYRSNDGVEWSTVALGRSLAVAAAATGSDLYAVGTSPAAAEDGPCARQEPRQRGNTVSLPLDLTASTRYGDSRSTASTSRRTERRGRSRGSPGEPRHPGAAARRPAGLQLGVDRRRPRRLRRRTAANRRPHEINCGGAPQVPVPKERGELRSRRTPSSSSASTARAGR